MEIEIPSLGQMSAFDFEKIPREKMDLFFFIRQKSLGGTVRRETKEGGGVGRCH